eukprot:XP_020398553.1 uncharacterized protein LOC109941756 [Zea mays]
METAAMARLPGVPRPPSMLAPLARAMRTRPRSPARARPRLPVARRPRRPFPGVLPGAAMARWPGAPRPARCGLAPDAPTRPRPVPPVVCPARSAHDPVPGARRRSLGSVCGHGGHGARARPRLPFPVSRPAGPRHARARPSSAAFARPGVQPPPRGSASSRPARSHPPLPGELARLAARRSVAMAWPQCACD